MHEFPLFLQRLQGEFPSPWIEIKKIAQINWYLLTFLMLLFAILAWFIVRTIIFLGLLNIFFFLDRSIHCFRFFDLIVSWTRRLNSSNCFSYGQKEFQKTRYGVSLVVSVLLRSNQFIQMKKKSLVNLLQKSDRRKSDKNRDNPTRRIHLNEIFCLTSKSQTLSSSADRSLGSFLSNAFLFYNAILLLNN